MFLLFLTTVQLNARIPQKLASWTLSYVKCNEKDNLFSATKHNSQHHPRTRLTCIATKYDNNHPSRTRLLIIDMKYTIFVHCHSLTGAATGVER